MPLSPHHRPRNSRTESTGTGSLGVTQLRSGKAGNQSQASPTQGADCLLSILLPPLGKVEKFWMLHMESFWLFCVSGWKLLWDLESDQGGKPQCWSLLGVTLCSPSSLLFLRLWRSPWINSLYSSLLCKDFEAAHRNTHNTMDKIRKDTGAEWTGVELRARIKCQDARWRALVLLGRREGGHRRFNSDHHRVTRENHSEKGVNKLLAWLVLVLGPARNFSSRDLQRARYLLWSTTASTVVLV